MGPEDPLEKEMAPGSSILVWEIPWTEEPGGLQSMGLQRVGHDLATEHTHTSYSRRSTFRILRTKKRSMAVSEESEDKQPAPRGRQWNILAGGDDLTWQRTGDKVGTDM